MTRFVCCCSLVGALTWWSLLLCSVTDKFVFAQDTFIDTDPAPGRSPGPPVRMSETPVERFYYPNSLPALSSAAEFTSLTYLHATQGVGRPSELPLSSIQSGMVAPSPSTQATTFENTRTSVDEENYLFTDHIDRTNEMDSSASHFERRRSREGGEDKVQDKRGGGHFHLHHQSAKRKHGINKLVTSKVDDEYSVAFKMNKSSHEARTKETKRMSTVSVPRIRRHARHLRATRTSDSHPLRYFSSRSSDIEHSEDDADEDWRSASLFCGDSAKQRENSRKVFLRQQNQVVVTGSPQDNRLRADTFPAVNTKRGWHFEKAPDDDGQIVVSENKLPHQLATTTANREGTGDPVASSNRHKASSHRFQKVSVESIDDIYARDEIVTKENETLWLLNASPQSSLDVDKDNGQTNNKLPLQFDLTHDVFAVVGSGLVANMEYTGEL